MATAGRGMLSSKDFFAVVMNMFGRAVSVGIIYQELFGQHGRS